MRIASRAFHHVASTDLRTLVPVKLALSRRARSPCVVLVGHFTPPVHGMAVAMDAVAAVLRNNNTRVVRVRTTPRGILPRAVHHLARIARVALALPVLVYMRVFARNVLLSVDAGQGMSYVILLAATARCLRYRLTLDHHSYAYVRRRSWLMSALARVAGPSATHLLKCPVVETLFKRTYGPNLLTDVLGVAYAVPERGASPGAAVSGPSRLTLGHLSNLSQEKGLATTIALGKEAVRLGLCDRLILAGPSGNSQDEADIRRAVAAGFAEYWGPLSAEQKSTFFGQVDVFIFPTRYRNELSPLVVWEALAHGVPVVAYRTACITQSAIGEHNLVLDPAVKFVEAALARLEHWTASPEGLRHAKEAARKTAAAQRDQALLDLHRLESRLLGQ